MNELTQESSLEYEEIKCNLIDDEDDKKYDNNIVIIPIQVLFTSTVVVSLVPGYFSRKAGLFLCSCVFHLLFNFLSLLFSFVNFNAPFFVAVHYLKQVSIY